MAQPSVLILRVNQDRYPAARRITLSIARLGIILPIHHDVGETQPPQHRRDILRTLLGESGFLDQAVPVGQDCGRAVSGYFYAAAALTMALPANSR